MSTLHAKLLSEITRLSQGNEITVLGDTDHRNRNLREFLYGADVVDSLRAGGVKNIFIEMDQGLQYLADDLEDGVITKDEFITKMDRRIDTAFDGTKEGELARYGDIAHMITHARDSGMKVHFADPGAVSAEPSPNVSDAYYAAVKETLGQYDIKPTGYDSDIRRVAGSEQMTQAWKNNLENHLQSLPPEKEQALRAEIDEFNKASDEADAVRVSDVELADYVSAVTGDQKAAVIYGSYHDNLRLNLQASGYQVGNIDIEAVEGKKSADDNNYDSVGYLDTDKIYKSSMAAPVNSPQAAPALQPSM